MCVCVDKCEAGCAERLRCLGCRVPRGVRLSGWQEENLDWMSGSTPLNVRTWRENFIDFCKDSSLSFPINVIALFIFAHESVGVCRCVCIPILWTAGWRSFHLPAFDVKTNGTVESVCYNKDHRKPVRVWVESSKLMSNSRFIWDFFYFLSLCSCICQTASFFFLLFPEQFIWTTKKNKYIKKIVFIDWINQLTGSLHLSSLLEDTAFEAGVRVQIHSQAEPPFVHELGFGVAPGFQTFVATQEQRVGVPLTHG